MKYYASLSYGKDSLAMLEAIHRLGYPIDGIIHAEVWATDDIPAELPEMVEFKAKADKIIKERYGLDVEHRCALNDDGSKKTFEQCFYRIPNRKKDGVNCNLQGKVLGWPLLKGRWCLRDLKLQVQKQSKSTIYYVGIAADETERIKRESNKKNILPLVEIGWSENDCMKWCEEHDLVSPIYTKSNRGGCWFCPLQPSDSLRVLYHEYPDLWGLLLKWDKDSPAPFRTDMRSARDWDKRFRAEDAGLVPLDRRFRWKMLDEL